MAGPLTTSRAARERRIVASAIWFALIVVAMVLWNTRTQRLEITNPIEWIAFLLAAFTTFVSLFAWMLFNPARGVSAETPTLMLAGMATMFPPCVIAFCTMPPGSPLSGWLTAGLFLLLLIAVMSPVPDEFFGIPRDRRSYMQSASALNFSEQFVVDRHPNWLQSTDLTAAVSDSSRPSLAPRSWREDEEPFTPRSSRRRAQTETIERSDPSPSVASAAPRKRRGFFRRRTEQAELSEMPTRDSETPRKRHNERPSVPVIPVPVESPANDEHGDSRRPQSGREAAKFPGEPSPELRRAKTDGDSDGGDPFTRDSRAGDDRAVIPLAESSPSVTDDIQVADRSRQTEFDRVRDELGGEMIEGTVVIHFARGQKRANVHVPFSPPLQGAPEVECSAVEHESVRVKVPECRTWGIRIEGRRTDTSRVEDVEVAFSAVYVRAT